MPVKTCGDNQEPRLWNCPPAVATTSETQNPPVVTITTVRWLLFLASIHQRFRVKNPFDRIHKYCTVVFNCHNVTKFWLCLKYESVSLGTPTNSPAGNTHMLFFQESVATERVRIGREQGLCDSVHTPHREAPRDTRASLFTITERLQNFPSLILPNQFSPNINLVTKIFSSVKILARNQKF